MYNKTVSLNLVQSKPFRRKFDMPLSSGDCVPGYAWTLFKDSILIATESMTKCCFLTSLKALGLDRYVRKQSRVWDSFQVQSFGTNAIE